MTHLSLLELRLKEEGEMVEFGGLFAPMADYPAIDVHVAEGLMVLGRRRCCGALGAKAGTTA